MEGGEQKARSFHLALGETEKVGGSLALGEMVGSPISEDFLHTMKSSPSAQKP